MVITVRLGVMILGGFYGPSLLADLVLDKYLGHMPLYRIEQLCALLNSVWAYHRDNIPVFAFGFNLSPTQLTQLSDHPLTLHIHSVPAFPFHCPGTWKAKQ